MEFVRELFALSLPTMVFCWYVYFYYTFMLLLPFVTMLFTDELHINFTIALLGIPFILACCLDLVGSRFKLMNTLLVITKNWFPIVLIGYLFAKHDLFQKLDAFNDSYCRQRVAKIFLCCLCIILSFLGRIVQPRFILTFCCFPIIHITPIFKISLDIIYAPLFIYSIIWIFQNIRLDIIRNILIPIGKYSLLMWFIHCIFFGSCKFIFQPILYFPRNPILVTAWGLLICLLIAIPVDALVTKIIRLKNKFLFD